MFLLLTKFSRHHSCRSRRSSATSRLLGRLRRLSHTHDIPSSSSTYLVAADFLERPVNVEQRHVVSFAGGKLLACGEHLLPPGGRVKQHGVHRHQRHDAQNLLAAGEVGGQQDGLSDETHEAGGRHTVISFGWSVRRRLPLSVSMRRVWHAFLFVCFYLGISGLQREACHLLSQNGEESLPLLPLDGPQQL